MDGFLLKYNAEELRIAAEFLSNWLPFLSPGLCKTCSLTLSDRIRSLDSGANVTVSIPVIVDNHQCMEYQDNCSTHSTGSRKDSMDDNDCAETFSLGSWKDEADGLSEHAVEESSTNDFIQSAPLTSTPVKKSWADVAQSPGMKKSWDDVARSSQVKKSWADVAQSPGMKKSWDDVARSSQVKKSWADMAQEDELEEDGEDKQINKFVIANEFRGDGTSPKDPKPKVELSRDQRECIRFGSVKRKKDFICLERVDGRLVNILDGLELHTGVFSTAEQTRIVRYVEQLQEMGRNDQLKDRTYSEPRKWMRGKGRVTLQFGCCYNYATDKVGNPPGILRNEIVDPLPQLFKVMIKRLVRWHVLPPSCVPDSCIVNIYQEGDCIPPHIDNHDFVRPFCTVSFLSECEIIFGSNLKIVGPGEFAGSFSIPLPVGSVLVLNGNGADVAKHCVPAVPTKRISITFRKMDISKRPAGYVPETDLQGLQPLPDEVDKSRKYSSRSRSSLSKSSGGREQIDRGKGSNSVHPEARHSGQIQHGPVSRRRF
ncbi:RNA demethylase ALKBH9B-like [Primulina huaijiensis]|uniref:RNA demethylase ALKBH9B-like n=1 Tax=Primulina huaijiensis TaxID=1492673 RepID=UPI003CC7274B